MGCELAAHPSERKMISNRISCLVDQLCSNKIFLSNEHMFSCILSSWQFALLLKFVVSAAELQFCIQPTRNTENSEDHRWKHTVISNLSCTQMPTTDQRTLSEQCEV